MEYKGVERRKRVRTPEDQKMDTTFTDIRKDAARFAIQDAALLERQNREAEEVEQLRAEKEKLEARISEIDQRINEIYPD